MLGLWKAITSMWLEGLVLFNQYGYIIFFCSEGIFTLFYNLFNLLLWIEGAWVEVVVVAMSFCSPFEQIVKKLNFAV